jgi:hypothetical protein
MGLKAYSHIGIKVLYFTQVEGKVHGRRKTK